MRQRRVGEMQGIMGEQERQSDRKTTKIERE